ncbi:hypothetical protein A2118_03755 [Candidatus Kaiserbacteria bacterium GWA2_50_9]|uniref:Uncharacterized protein n=1 Tax=Candidatus Kaiserbacteria bacterium GWA2_50_9 TaxID=1798474 RepID=A0A1F6BTI6_9BACT|nr:MAG: hypothetical protein A2118_03755 [Candidatus Kaiserbacteria bacterium GWA2_50_9]
MADNNKEIIVALKSYPTKSYESLDLDRLAVYALCVLDQKKIPMYFDYAAVALFKLFPGKFSMENFSQYPDTNRINKTLRRLTDQKRKNWATGTVENGFSLNELGREVGKQIAQILSSPNQQMVPKTPTRSRGRSVIEETKEVKSSEAFKAWQAGEEINNYQFLDFLKATPYVPGHLLAQHLMRLKDSATTTKDKEVLEFLEWLENRFKNLLD